MYGNMEIWIDSSKYGSLQICSRKVLMILGIKRIELYLKPQFEKQELILIVRVPMKNLKLVKVEDYHMDS